MTKYALITDNIVQQIDVVQRDGFIAVADDVLPGQIMQKDGSFTNPAPVAPDYQAKRQAAYEAKGWTDPYALIEDILKRGLTAVKNDREGIKQLYPKE